MANSNEYMRKYMLERYRKRRTAAIRSLGGKCSICGTTRRLEIDHKNPTTKTFAVGEILASGSEEKVQSELKKCQLLCYRHHQDKSITERGQQRAQCGTLSGYRYCRCEKCKEAKRVYAREYKRKRRLVHVASEA